MFAYVDGGSGTLDAMTSLDFASPINTVLQIWLEAR